MMAEQIKTRMTAAEFLQLPETNLPAQLLNGEVIEMSTPELPHQDVVLNIGIFFRQKSKELGGKAYVAPVDVYFDELNIPSRMLCGSLRIHSAKRWVHIA